MIKHPLSPLWTVLFTWLTFTTSSSAEESKRALPKPINVPLTVHYDGTEMQWYGPIQVGTPPQDFNVVFDAYGIEEEIQIISKQCTNCTKQQNKFNYNRSSTFSGLSGVPGDYLIYSPGLGVNPNKLWQYELLYGVDKITVGGVSVSNLSIGLVIDESKPFRKVPWDGIMGVQPQGLFGFFTSLIEQGLPAVLGYDLAPQSAGPGQLTIGGVDQTRYQGDFLTIPGVFTDAFTLKSNFIAVNGQTTPELSSGILLFPTTTVPTWILDPLNTEAIYSLISPDIKPYPEHNKSTKFGSTYGIPCSKIPHLKASIDLSFNNSAGQPVNLTIPTSELSIGPFASNKSMCQTFIAAYEEGGSFGYIGGSLLKHYYVKFNFTAAHSNNLERSVGFAKRA